MFQQPGNGEDYQPANLKPNNIMKKIIASSLLTLFLLAAYAQEARISEEYIPFTTYSFNDPDPVARPGSIFRTSGLTDFHILRKW